MHKGLAELICHSNAVVNPQKWLAEEACDLAFRIHHLDEIPAQAILPLAKLVEIGDSSLRTLTLSLDIDELMLAKYIEALCEFNFVEEAGKGFKATEAGKKAFEAVGERMVTRMLFEFKGQLEHLERLQRQLHKL